MYYGYDSSKAVYFSGESSSTTHRSTATVLACRYVGGLVWGALNGVSKEELLSPNYSPDPSGLFNGFNIRDLDPAIPRVTSGSFKLKHPPGIRGSGFAAESLEAALWAFHTTDNFASGCLRVVNLGEDADTTGAVYGQIAGAYYGYDAIPEHWRNRIKHHEMISDFALRLMK